MNNSERLVVVTGGTKGIGKAIIHRFAADGMPIATCARNKKDLASLREEVNREHSNVIHTHVADLSKREGIKDFIAFIRMIDQPVEVLVNNTGVFIPGLVHEEAEGSLEKMMNTNLYSAYHLSRGIIPQMMNDKRGHIFNLCSVASLNAYPNGGSYSISKFAMYGFSKALREELKEFSIRVTSILAGAVKTPSWDEVELPEERFMKPEDIAETIHATYRLSKRTVVEDIILRPQLGDI